jgi:DNA repair protein RadC
MIKTQFDLVMSRGSVSKMQQSNESLGRVEQNSDIITAEQAHAKISKFISNDAEELWALALSPRKKLIKSKMIFRGTVDACLVHPRDIFRFACKENASSLIVVHNHPSGDLTPSLEDLDFTRKLLAAGALMEIPVLDHLIVNQDEFISIRRDGWCNFELD